MLKINDYIEVRNDTEWFGILDYLFGIGFVWCDGTTKRFKCNYTFPDYLLIEINHKDYNSKQLMLSYAHIPYPDIIVHKASKFLRKKKLERILK